MASRLFPFIDASAAAPPAKDAPLPPFKEYAWDFENDALVLADGNPVILEGAEALKTWMHKALKTPRYAHEAHTWGFGCELERLIGSEYSAGAKGAEAERYVTEALLCNPYVLGVADFEAVFADGAVSMSCTAKTVYGDVGIGLA